MVTALVYHEKYLDHVLSQGHPERPERLKAIVAALKKSGLWSSPEVKVIEPSPAELEDIEFVHDSEYIELVKKLSRFEKPLDADTPVHSNTFELALLAAGGAIAAGRAVMLGEAGNAFALVRPPGHHAGRASGGGFCYFNNLAVMIERLKREFKLRRVFILDFDAHHGNGTQDIYFEDPSVLLMSVHQDGRTLYPGTGFIHELGSGKGEGYTINVPLPPGSSDAEYATLMEDIFFPVSEAFRPELIAVSAGFDAHAEDPLTGLELSTAAYGWLVRYAVKQAEKLCDGRVVLTLEGGYALDAIAGAAVKIVEVLTGKRPAFPPKRQKVGVVDELKQRLSRYWPL